MSPGGTGLPHLDSGQPSQPQSAMTFNLAFRRARRVLIATSLTNVSLPDD